MCVYMYHLCLVSVEARGGCRFPYKWLRAFMWVMGTEPDFSVKVVSALNHRSTSPAP